MNPNTPHEKQKARSLQRMVRRLRGTVIPHIHRYDPTCEGAPGGHFEWLGLAFFWCRHDAVWRSWRVGKYVGWIDPSRD